MRMWSIAPRFLDRQGLVAAWRESLLAQAVLLGNTKGYTNHPQLVRFKRTSDPARFVGAYLHVLADEADSRSYKFDRSRVALSVGEAQSLLATGSKISVQSGQVKYEFEHLLRKLSVRNPDQVSEIESVYDSLKWDASDAENQMVHSLFVVVPGGVESWEIT